MDNNEQIVVVPMPGQGNNVPVPQKSDKADLIDKINPDRMVIEIRHRLLGEEFNGREISSLMMGTSSINTTISKYKEETIKARLRRIAKDAQYMLISNWREYGVRNTAQFYFVHSIVFSNALAVLSQAGEGSIQELVKGTVYENRNVNTEKKEPGKLRRMLGMG
jgi:hypothetical protein